MKYKNEVLKEENANLSHQLKIITEKLEQQKNINKTLSDKHENKIKQIYETNMSNLSNNLKQIKECKKEIEEYNDLYMRFQTFLETDYYFFNETFPKTFTKISDLINKFKLKKLLCNPELVRDPNFDYERALIEYGSFHYLTRFLKNKFFEIPQEDFFDPHKLELPTQKDLFDPHKLELQTQKEPFEIAIDSSKQEDHPFLK